MSADSCHPCQDHAGFDEAIKNLKRDQEGVHAAIIRIWAAIEKRVSVKLFLTILTISVAVVGLFNGIFFYSQDRIFTNYDSTLAKISDKQDRLLDRVNDLRLYIKNGSRQGTTTQ